MTNQAPPRTDVASLNHGDRSVDLPLVHGTEDEVAADISKLRGETGLITLDVGYGNTGATRSAITFLDGEGDPALSRLSHRGAGRAQHVPGGRYLLIHGELPTRAELDHFVAEITHHTLIREEMRHFFDSFPHDAHPMAVLASGTVGMSTFYPDSHEISDPAAVQLTTLRLIAKLPTLAAWSFKKAIGQPYVYPATIWATPRTCCT